MNAFQLFKEEIGKLAEKKTLLFSVIAVLLVPLLYAAILLSSKAGPYDNTDNLPVAVVNNDKGADSNGEPMNVGNDLVEDLKSNKALGWDFVSSEEAEQGMKEMKYYMVIEIPEDFSANITSVLEPTPKKAELKFTQNEGLHYMAARVTDSAVETIRTQLSAKATETYVRTLFSQLGQVNDGFKEAADGSEQIHDGSSQLKDGTGQILTSLNEKSGDIGKLAAGAKELNAGTGELLSNLKGKSGDITKLATGASQLNAGTGQLVNALTDKKGDVAKLVAGAKELESGVKQNLIPNVELAVNGAAALKSGSTDLNNGLEPLQKGSEEVAEGINMLVQLIRPQISNLTLPPYLDEQTTEALLDNLLNGANSLKDNLSSSSVFGKGLSQLEKNLGDLANGLSELHYAVGNENYNKSLVNAVSQISSGNQQLVNTLTESALQLHSGASQIKDGNSAVASGWNDLTVGASQLHAGSTQISDGNQSVKAGWDQLTDGVSQVDDGLQQLNEGSNELMTGLQSGAESTEQLKVNDDNMEMFAMPVQVDGEIINSFPYYRDSDAPFILSLALFVGVLIMSLVVQFQKPAAIPASGVSWFTGKLMKLSVLAIAQALFVSLFTLIFLRLQVESSIMLILFSIGVSLTFLMIILFLVALAGNLGRFIALALILFQLKTTGTSLPIEMLPEGVRNISSFLPLTFSIDGFRNIITLGNFENVASNMGILLIFLILFGILAFIVFSIKFKDIDKDNHFDGQHELAN